MRGFANTHGVIPDEVARYGKHYLTTIQPRLSEAAYFGAEKSVKNKIEANVRQSDFDPILNLKGSVGRAKNDLSREVSASWVISPVRGGQFWDHAAEYSPEFAMLSSLPVITDFAEPKINAIGRSDEAVSLEVRNYGGRERLNIGLSFYASSRTADSQRVGFRVRTNVTEQLAKDLKADVYYQHEFFLFPTITKVGLLYSGFILYADGKRLDRQIELEVFNVNYGPNERSGMQRLTEFGFVLSTESPAGQDHSLEPLPTRFEVDILDSLNFLDYVPTLESLFQKDRETKRSPIERLLRSSKNLDPDSVSSFEIELRESYRNSSVHRTAARIGARGPRAIEQAFRNLDWGENRPRRVLDFVVGKPLAGRATLVSDVLYPIHQYQIPYETGAFADIHGEHSHHVATLGLLMGLRPSSRWLFAEMISLITNPSVSMSGNWLLWNGFFDGTGRLANSPTYWKALVDEELRSLRGEGYRSGN